MNPDRFLYLVSPKFRLRELDETVQKYATSTSGATAMQFHSPTFDGQAPANQELLSVSPAHRDSFRTEHSGLGCRSAANSGDEPCGARRHR
jgi:hypothetical protein